jgi:hypothetical protein
MDKKLSFISNLRNLGLSIKGLKDDFIRIEKDLDTINGYLLRREFNERK